MFTARGKASYSPPMDRPDALREATNDLYNELLNELLKLFAIDFEQKDAEIAQLRTALAEAEQRQREKDADIVVDMSSTSEGKLIADAILAGGK